MAKNGTYQPALKRTDNGRNGIPIADIPDGTVIEVRTVNTLYKLTKIKDDEFMIQGGDRYPEPKQVIISGCTYRFHGDKIKPGWIVERYYLEIIDGKRIIGTSHIKNIKIVNEKEESE